MTDGRELELGDERVWGDEVVMRELREEGAKEEIGDGKVGLPGARRWGEVRERKVVKEMK